MPRPGGASSAYLLRTDRTAVLFDIGSGAVAKLQLAIEYPRLDAIVISHLHADHFFDLVPLRYGLKYGEQRRENRLPVWIPPGGRRALDSLRKAVSQDAPDDFFDAVFEIDEYDPREPLPVKELSLRFCRTRHYIEAYAVRAESSGGSLAYSADTAPCEAIVEHARGSSLFLCEAALGLATEEGVRGHSSAFEAGEMAQEARVGHLVLTHYPAWYPASALVEAAREAFTGRVSAADDGSEFAI
jgi:ribonuclease BN (tRNA processing enzyme)